MDTRSGPGGPPPPDRHAVEDADERARLLGRLLTDDAMVVLHLHDDEGTAVVSRLLAVDAASDRVELEFVTDDGRRTAFRDAGRALARASLDGIVLRFELEPARPLGEGEQGRLVAPLPRRLARLQRREAYRVAPPASALPRLFLALDDGEREARILDVSATGVAFEWPAPQQPPTSGTRLAGCRLELPATAPIPCALVVRTSEPRQEGPARLGGELEGLEPAAARAVQVFVNLAQIRGRRVRPRLR